MSTERHSGVYLHPGVSLHLHGEPVYGSTAWIDTLPRAKAPG
jgi:hypothetical protein